MTHKHPLSERLQSKYGIEPDDMKDVVSMERTNTARYVHAGSNGVVEHWWKWGSRASVILGALWFVFGAWDGMDDRVAALQAQVAAVATEVAELGDLVQGMRFQIYGLELAAGQVQTIEVPRQPSRPPVFPRDEQFSVVDEAQ